MVETREGEEVESDPDDTDDYKESLLKSRDFQGMEFSVPAEAVVGVLPGQFGTASSGYRNVPLPPLPKEL